MASSPLRGAGEAIRNPVLPKTMSWFALGGPLELLSPLSCWRMLMIGTAAWCGVLAALASTTDARLGAISAGSALLAIWIGLLGVRRVAATASEALGVALLLAVAFVAWTGRRTLVAASALPWLVGGAVIAGLFLAGRAIGRLQLFTGVALCIALLPTAGPARAVAVAAVGCATTTIVASVVAYLASSARRAGVIDADTGLPNGFGLAQRLAGRNTTATLVVAVVALAGLDEAREALGYEVGTELLRRVVEDLGQVLPPDAVVGRVAGDELVVAVPTGGHGEGASDEVPPAAREAAEVVAATLGRAVRAGRYLVGEIELAVRSHIGLAVAPWHGDGVADLVRRASVSAGRAQAGGVAHLWDGGPGAMTRDDLALLADLRLAGERNELRLFYQPKVDARSARMVSVEALLRWESPVHGAVDSGRLIPLAERTGAVSRLTEWVLAEALDAQVRWRANGVELPVSVNLSATTLTREDLAPWVLGEVGSRSLPHNCLVLELTETAATTDLMAAIEALRPLHDRGVRLSIDDFGTGYTSLSALPGLPVDELKIDQCFVRRLTSSLPDEAIVRSVTELAHRLGLRVVAEGVEDLGIAERARALGIDQLQGYHFSRPLPEADLLLAAAPNRLPATFASSADGAA